MTHVLVNPTVYSNQPYVPAKAGATPVTAMLAANENPLGPGQLARRAMQGAAHGIGRYPDIASLIDTISAFHSILPDSVIVGNGSNDILDIIARTFVSDGREVVVSSYAFVVYKMVSALAGAHIRTVPSTAYGHDIAAMVDAVTPNTAVLWIANPNNPTGTYTSHDELLKHLRRVPETCVVVLDEAYIDYLEKDHLHTAIRWLKSMPNLIIVRTFSKLHGLAGLRVGYAVAQPELIALMNRVRQPFNVNSIAIAAAAASLNDTAHRIKTKHQNSAALQSLMQTCDAMNITYVPSHANFLMIDISNRPIIYDALCKQGIITLPLASYDLPHMLRITTGTPAQMKLLVNTIHNTIGDSKGVQ